MQRVRAWLLMMYLGTRKKKKDFLNKPSDYSQMLSPILYTCDRTRWFGTTTAKRHKKIAENSVEFMFENFKAQMSE